MVDREALEAKVAALIWHAMRDHGLLATGDAARAVVGLLLTKPERLQENGSVRFEVVRTSRRAYRDEKPCAEAVEGTTPVWDARTFKSPEEHDAKLREKWHDRGTDHQFIYGPRGGVHGITRRLDDRKAWFVDIDSLEALMAFYEKYGDLVISESWSRSGVPCLEIYDGDRE